MATLSGRTVFITGGSRGVGLAIARRCGADGANVVLAAKTERPHPKLPGTLPEAAAAVEAAGGRCLPVVTDIRDEAAAQAAVDAAVARFGGIDILVNNASAIDLRGTLDLPMKRFDLMHQVNARGTYLCSQSCLPHLLRAENPHILTLAPPLDLQPRWFSGHVGYSLAKFGMSLCMLGMAEEFRDRGVACNALWPRTLLKTAAVDNLLGGPALSARGRHPEIVADAAHVILTRPSRECTGQFFIDEDVLRGEGVTDFSGYQVDPALPESELVLDLFVDR
ncbi:SDR family oxidoreductase [Spiribacter halobius]|uniref:Short chain dehydrogenase n=1 Tax=Sediminicurvatus halobius TaxID=2182432 RepID=A0A2U2N390_9GAMM|nr:NAD(P)-dependent oxidoreductase [Spiribacter halobius]PWG63563.1 short chain dehydrogenase [Spiribacter halobius]UEX79558.1 NAD(P)-dependent oxidoreductase [Spiribacter halobius]